MVDAIQGAPASASVRDRTIKKLNRRIVLFSFICFLINYLDRANIGFAALHMNRDIGLTPGMFGFGAGIFFIGYMAFEVPSNMALHRFGPRVWIARIMVTWGIVSCCMLLVQGPVSFYILRFLLGVAEAGFAPGVLLYLTYWYPKQERGRATALFMTATVLSLVFGSPLSGWILQTGDGLFGLSGWQAMFLIEGVPAIVLGVIAFFFLIDRPEDDRRWLTEEERNWLITELARDEEERKEVSRHSLGEVFRDYRVWMLTLVYMFFGIAVYGVIMWLPQIVDSLGTFTPLQTGLISAIPFVFSALGLVLIARSSDRTGERKFHNIASGLVGGVFLGLSALAGNPLLGLVLLCICAFFLWAYLGIFWTLPTQFLSGAAAAGGLAAINGFAQFGGLIGPWAVGLVKEATGSFQMSLLTLAVFPLIGALLLLVFPARRD